jgi:hypothetical protein
VDSAWAEGSAAKNSAPKAVSNGNDSAAGLLIQPDGKIVVAGDSVTATGHDIALARLLAR